MNADRPEFIGSGCCPYFIGTALSTQRVEIGHTERYVRGVPRRGSAAGRLATRRDLRSIRVIVRPGAFRSRSDFSDDML
jgi:hypothetical protein